MYTLSIRPTCLVALAIALFGGAATIGAAQQGVGSITGHVVDTTARRALVGAQVLVGTRRTFTDVKGEFRVDDVPAGEVEVRVRLIGYATAARKVTVRAGETASVEVVVAPTAVALEAVVVTATGEERAREEGNAVQKLDAAKLVKQALPNNLTDLLSRRCRTT